MRPNGERWRELRYELDLSLEVAANGLKIAPGSLQNIESNQPRATVSKRLVYRATRLYRVEFAELVLDDGDGVPTNPPSKEQKQETNTGPRPRKDPAKRSPKKLTDAAVA